MLNLNEISTRLKRLAEEMQDFNNSSGRAPDYTLERSIAYTNLHDLAMDAAIRNFGVYVYYAPKERLWKVNVSNKCYEDVDLKTALQKAYVGEEVSLS